MLKRPKLSTGFQGRFLKQGEGGGLWGVGSTGGHSSDGLVVRSSGVNIISLLVPTGLGSTCLWAACS